MSWDVLVFDLGGNPPPIGEMGSDFKPNSMGSVADVRQKISAHLSNVNWSDPSWGIYDGNGYSFEFSVGEVPETSNFMVHVRGGGDAITDLLRFSVPNGWSLFDCSSGEFIDSKNPSDQSWVAFQNYRDQALKD